VAPVSQAPGTTKGPQVTLEAPVISSDLERETGFEPATLSLGRRVHQPSIFPSAPNSSERLGSGRIVTSQNPQRLGTAPNRPAAPLLQGTNAPATTGAPLRVVDGGRGNLLTVRDVAGRLGVSTATVYKLAARGDLPNVRVSNAIRIHPEDLAAYMKRARRA
jgi:excisionase family DNA binding protein